MQTAQGAAPAQWMQLVFQLNASQLAVFAVIGGPGDAAGNNAYVVAVNSPSGNTGPGTGAAPPAGYYGTTCNNRYVFQANWGGATLYVAYLGSATVDAILKGVSPSPVTVTLQSL